jgi:hypothetical protein
MLPALKSYSWIFFLIFLSIIKEVSAQVDPTEEVPKGVTLLPGRDSTFLNPVFLNREKKGYYYYECLVNTPVCNDTLCQLVRLNIFWDLSGNYIQFDTIPGYPLSKNDHKPFNKEDYQKLHATLSDGNSVLRRKAEDELLDTTQTRYSEKIDGATGATALQIKHSVVEGALYSTYSLWHLANGNFRKSLKDATLKNYDTEIENQLLSSEDPKMVLMALKQWKDQDYEDRFPDIISVIQKGYPLINFYIAKNLPYQVFTSEKNHQSIIKIWDHLDPNTKSILQDYIKFGVKINGDVGRDQT